MTLRIPIPAKPLLTFSVTLGGQRCKINIVERTTGVFMDLSIGSVQIIAGAICLDRVRIVRSKYSGFVGDLAFVDTQGTLDPTSDGFGSRYQLLYLEE